MVELELLGLQDNGMLALNDSEGNRYLLPITDKLRAALRTDIEVTDAAEPHPMSIREVQAHIRAGLSVTEVSEISSYPASRVASLANPIIRERMYTAEMARGFRQGRELGDMTLEELVVSRLVARDVAESDISWDAYRKEEEPWMLVARYICGDKEHTALWRVNLRSRTVNAANDEAIWLTETQIPAPTSPWRPVNTPAMSADSGDDARGRRKLHTAIDAHPAAAGTPVDIDLMLDALNSRRGTAQPMPFLTDPSAPSPASHNETSSSAESSAGADILSFPTMGSTTGVGHAISGSSALQDSYENDSPSDTPDSALAADATSGASISGENDDAHRVGPRAVTAISVPSVSSPEASSHNTEPAVKADSASSAPESAEEALPGLDVVAPEKTKKPAKKRRSRPALPTFDEIVYGQARSDREDR
ncbi:septation protein SepH [Trueperella sp. LYQ143]|uniref:septation protein SepH n=1 Tax=Trueperella sp. LYQ143 TaxID=3391059 RepID=UPI0039839C80